MPISRASGNLEYIVPVEHVVFEQMNNDQVLAHEMGHYKMKHIARHADRPDGFSSSTGLFVLSLLLDFSALYTAFG